MRSALFDAVPPVRKVPERAAPVLGPYEEVVWGWLTEDLTRRPSSVTRARSVGQRLLEEQGATVAESSVRAMVAALEVEVGLTRREVMVPQTHPPAEEALCGTPHNASAPDSCTGVRKTSLVTTPSSTRRRIARPSPPPRPAVLGDEPLPHPPGGVPLLTWRTLVRDQPGVDDLSPRVDRRLAPVRVLPPRRRHGRHQRLTLRPSVHPVPAGELTHRHARMSPGLAPDLLEDFHPGPSPHWNFPVDKRFDVKTLTAGGPNIRDDPPTRGPSHRGHRGGAEIRDDQTPTRGQRT